MVDGPNCFTISHWSDTKNRHNLKGKKKIKMMPADLLTLNIELNMNNCILRFAFD